MPNRVGRPRHLTVVPDLLIIPDASPRCLSSFDDRVERSTSAIVQFILRVSVDAVTPDVWRRLRVRSDLLLPELHSILRSSVGWTNSDEHSFTATINGRPRTYDTQNVVDETGAGHSEELVRLDAVLSVPGDNLRYVYGPGAGWVHTVELESIDRDIDDLRPLCIDGGGGTPPEDCGGPLGYRADPGTPGEWDPKAFDVSTTNFSIRTGNGLRSIEAESAAASPLIGRLLRRAHSADTSRLSELLPRCELTIESSVDTLIARKAMSKLSWFLRRVGEHGIALTDTKHLPAPVVRAIRNELDWGIGWHGESCNEKDHHQATDLREAAKSLGLVRVLKGALVRTKAGERLVDDHVGLWHHCARRVPIGNQDYEVDAGTLFLVALAASASAEQRDPMIVDTMHAMGWGVGEVNSFDAHQAAHPTVAFLDLIGAHGPLYYLARTGSEAPSWARRFARDALRT